MLLIRYMRLISRESLNETLVKLDVQQCIDAYAISFVSKVRNSLLVSKNTTLKTETVLREILSGNIGSPALYAWIYQGYDRLNIGKKNTSHRDMSN